jgi:hypothetical protein
MHYLNLVVDPLNQELMQSRRNAAVGVNPIMTKNDAIVTLHLNDEEWGSEWFAPPRWAPWRWHLWPPLGCPPPPTPLSIRLVFMSSSSSRPSFLNTTYDIRLTATPPSMSILEISFPLMWPQMYNGFKCWLDYSGFSNTVSLGLRHI